MAKKIILDCDPGHDDAIALLLAHGSPEIELLAVTTVAGNQTLEKVTRNALAVATIGNITDVPIAAGAGVPLVRPQIVAEEDRKSTRLNSSHVAISYAVFCLKKKNKRRRTRGVEIDHRHDQSL